MTNEKRSRYHHNADTQQGQTVSFLDALRIADDVWVVVCLATEALPIRVSKRAVCNADYAENAPAGTWDGWTCEAECEEEGKVRWSLETDGLAWTLSIQ